MTIDLEEDVQTFVTSGRINEAIEYLEQGLSKCPSPKFKSLIGGKFTNDPKDVALHIRNFVITCEKAFQVKSVYLEMNGFDINPDYWYFDLFAYDQYVDDSGDLDWLADWNSGDWPQQELTGLEKAQEDYAWYTGASTKGYEDSDAEEASGFARFLVMCKFASLIEESVKTGTIDKNVPILATAHDFDIISTFAA